MRCSYCPIPAALACRGEEVHRFCELIDPGNASYAPDYANVLRSVVQLQPSAAEPRPKLTVKVKVVEALERVQAMYACPYRSLDAGCGCSGAKCGLRHGEIVSYADCFECIRRYG